MRLGNAGKCNPSSQADPRSPSLDQWHRWCSPPLGFPNPSSTRTATLASLSPTQPACFSSRSSYVMLPCLASYAAVELTLPSTSALPSPPQGYLLGATLEIKFLQGEAAKLYVRPVIPVMRDRRKSEQLEEEWVAGVRRQARLLRWAARNRAWTCSLIGLMLL